MLIRLSIPQDTDYIDLNDYEDPAKLLWDAFPSKTEDDDFTEVDQVYMVLKQNQIRKLHVCRHLKQFFSTMKEENFVFFMDKDGEYHLGLKLNREQKTKLGLII